MRRSTGAALAALAALAGGCMMPRYLAQASYGQFDLLARARPIRDVVIDPETPERTRVLLSAVPAILDYGARRGLEIRRNYRNYAEVDAGAAVWFVGAAPRLSFEPRKWCFPIAGCFTGLGWFEEEEALAHRAQLERDGWDAMARPAIAYSTGGWFPDPVLSSMLSDDDDAWAELANVLLHESVHATVFVPDQPFFNEGLASYVADTMTDDWLVATFGATSPERTGYQADEARRQARISRLLIAYDELDRLYRSTLADRDKLARKRAIIDRAVLDLGLRTRPNNASLVELRVYRASGDGFARAHAACGDLTRLMDAAKQLRRRDFAQDLDENLGPVLTKLATRCATSARRR